MIDLYEFLDETADRSGSWRYRLHCVITYSGDLVGHYSAFIKPGRDARWLKFDDDRVIPVLDREVLEENYDKEGSSSSDLETQATRAQTEEMSTSAYMLMYVRETAIDEILTPFTEEDVPPHLGKLKFCSQLKSSNSSP